MISYKNWEMIHKSKSLQESVGSTFNLGVTQKQNLGMSEMGMMPKRYMDDEEILMKKKNPMGNDDEEEEINVDGVSDDDMGDEEIDMDVDDDMGDDDMDSDDDVGDDMDDMGDDDMDDEDDEEEILMKKKSPMGDPHDSSAFMGYMKKEACSCDDKEDKKDDSDDEESDDKDMLMKPGKDKPEFMMKKKMKKKMKKENIEEMDTSDVEFMKSMLSYVTPKQKHFDGIDEDVLLASELKPGEPGYAPATRIGMGSEEIDMSNILESVKHLLKRVSKLEKKLM